MASALGLISGAPLLDTATAEDRLSMSGMAGRRAGACTWVPNIVGLLVRKRRFKPK